MPRSRLALFLEVGISVPAVGRGLAIRRAGPLHDLPSILPSNSSSATKILHTVTSVSWGEGGGDKGEQKRADDNTSSERRPSTPRRRAGEGFSHVLQNPNAILDRQGGVAGGGAVGTSTGHGWVRPASPSLRRFHKQETVPGRLGPDGRPHLKPWGRGLCSRGTHRGQLLQQVLRVGALHNRGKGRKVSRLNKEQEGGDSRAPPLQGAQLQKPLSGVQPPSLPHPLRQRQLRIHPMDRAPAHRSGG